MRKPERVQQHTRVPAERLSTVLCTSVMGCSDSKPQPVRPVPSSPPEAGAKYEIPASASDPAQAAAEDKLNSTSSSARSAQQPPSNADAFPASAHFPKLVGNSFVARHLTQRLYEELHGRGSTRNGWNVDRAIQCAVDYPVLDGSRIAFGLFCGDAESYELLRPLLVPVVREFHGFDMETSRHACDTIPAHVSVPEPDPTGRYVLSSRVRGGRQLRDLSFSPGCSRAERRRVEELLQRAFSELPQHLRGVYESRSGMTAERHAELRETKQLLFEDPDLWTILSGMARDWPDGRGIFVSHHEHMVGWVNEEDHLRAIASEPGPHVRKAFRRWCTFMSAVEESLATQGSGFAMHETLGALTPCPSNLGTGGFRVSVRVQFPLLGRKRWFKRMCKSMAVRARGHVASGPNDARFSGTFELSNIACLGQSEVELVNTTLQCVTTCIGLEKRMEEGKPVTPEYVGLAVEPVGAQPARGPDYSTGRSAPTTPGAAAAATTESRNRGAQSSARGGGDADGHSVASDEAERSDGEDERVRPTLDMFSGPLGATQRLR